jgi:hypothetical protein
MERISLTVFAAVLTAEAAASSQLTGEDARISITFRTAIAFVLIS